MKTCEILYLHTERLSQVVDLANLHPGIDQYYRGHVRPDSSTARTARTKPLSLLHYTGSDRLGEVMTIIT